MEDKKNTHLWLKISYLYLPNPTQHFLSHDNVFSHIHAHSFRLTLSTHNFTHTSFLNRTLQ